MLLYTMIYSTYCIPVSSDKFREEQVKSMNMNREYTVFEDDVEWRKRKRLQLLEENDFRGATFTKMDV